jgi:hemoglobin/transferrin/lactoferrin receptor protein
MKTACIITALLALHVSAAAAATDITVDPITISARGRAATLTETPGGVGVVTEEEIAEAPKASVADALARIPGISMSGDSPWGRDVSIRGLTGASVIVLIDGKRINTATDINARLGFINPMDIERVEVLKGPVSSLYGSGSTGGVINIVTRKGSFSEKGAVHAGLSQSVSSNPLGYDGYADIHYDGKRFWLFGSAAGRDHGDTFGGDNSRINNSRYSDVQGRMAAGVRVSDSLTMQLQAMRLEGYDIGIPGGPTTLPKAARVTYPRTSFTFLSLDTTWTPGGDLLKEVEASIYYNRNERRVRVDELGTLPIREILPGANHDSLGGKLQAILETGSHTVVTGVDAWNWDMDSWRLRYMRNGTVREDEPVPDARQTSVGIFAEDDWRLSRALTLNLGARVDGIETRNDAGNGFPAGADEDIGWNLHAGLAWTMTPEWSQSLIVASSYRAADILERFKLIDLGGGQQLKGDPGLLPEKSVFAEYGAHYRDSSVSADARFFVNLINDYITEQRVSPALLTMANVGEALIYGTELEGRWRFAGPWGLFGALTGLVGRDESADEPLRGIAPLSGTTGVEYDNGRFRARLDTRWAAPQHETPPDVASTAGYVTFNAMAGYRFAAWSLDHDVSLVLDNLLDQRYRNYLSNARGIDLLEPGFSAMLNYTVEL